MAKMMRIGKIERIGLQIWKSGKEGVYDFTKYNNSN